MIAMFSLLLASLVMLHPGHSTRIEVQWNAAGQSLELAMRIDHADLEAGLRKRLRQPVVVEELTAEQAEKWIGEYVRETLRIDEAKIPREQFSWVGWERKRVSSWSYAELAIADRGAENVALKILTLLEVEPELNHVVTIRRADQQISVVLTKEKPVVDIPLRSR